MVKAKLVVMLLLGLLVLSQLPHIRMAFAALENALTVPQQQMERIAPSQ